MEFLWEGIREAGRLLADRDADVFHALGVSLLCSVLAVAAAALVAIPYGAYLGLLRPRTHRAQVFVLRVLLSVPTVVIGLVLYGFITRRGLLGDLGLMHTKTAITIGLALLAFPLLATHVHGAVAGLDRIVVDEARTLGAGTIRTVRLGLAEVRPSLATAVLTAFGRCITELGIGLMIGGGIRLETRTLPAAISLEVSKGEFGRALAPGFLLLVVAAVATLLAHRLSRERHLVMRGVDVSVRFGSVVALPPTTFDVQDGGRLCVCGPNGSGKTTLLRVLARLLEPTSGQVSGRPPRGTVVLVHQRPHLFRGSALENVVLAARLGGFGESHALALLDRLGLAAIARRAVGALSGGERRRVAIARALARGPTTLLLDEPLAELDPSAADRVAAAVAEFQGTVVTTSPIGRSPLANRELRLGE